jgi:hypothetical protein
MTSWGIPVALRRDRSWIYACAVATVLGCLPLIALAVGGAIGVPWADDWAYERMAVLLEQTSHLHFIGWNDVSMVGHLVWAVPWIMILGPGMATVHVAGAAAAVAGLLGAFALFRKFLDTRDALLGIAAVGASPIYVLLAGTYMTDIPAFATEMWCLALGIAWLRAGSRSLLLGVAALAIGAFGFTIRESALSAPAAVLIAGLVTSRSREERLRVAAAGIALVAALGTFYVWRAGLADRTFGRSPQLLVKNDLLALCRASMLVSLIAAPISFAAFVSLRQRIERRTLALGAAVAVTAALLPLSQSWYYGLPQTIFPGNLVAQDGALGDRVLVGARPMLFPEAAWVGIQGVAVLSACVVFAMAFRAARRYARPLSPGVLVVAGYLGLSIVAFAGRADTNATLYDRYLLGTVAIAILVLLVQLKSARVRVAPVAVLFGVSAAISAVLLLDSIAYTRTRWSAGEQAVAAGVPAPAVDAGFEWSGYHHPGRIGDAWTSATNNLSLSLLDSASPFAVAFGNSPCVVLADSPRPRSQFTGAIRYTALGGLVKRKLFIYRLPRVCAALGIR